MTPDQAVDAVNNGRRAVMRYTSPDMRHSSGTVVAYCAAPAVLIETPTGVRVWWRADLTDIAEEPT